MGFSEARLDAISSILIAALGSASCSGVLLLRTRPDGCNVVARAGRPPDVVSSSLGESLRRISSFGGLVMLCDDDMRRLLDPHASLPSSLLACLSVRGREGDLIAQALFFDGPSHVGFSMAQRYALRAYGVQLEKHLSEKISNDKSMHESSMELLRLFESAVTHANDAILITEADPIDHPGPRIVYCNPSFTRTTGYSEAEVIGRSPRMLQCAGTDREALDRIRGALKRWSPIEIELLNAKKDDTLFWVEVSIVPVADASGWFTHWVSVQRDVTERRRLQKLENEAEKVIDQRRILEHKLHERERAAAELAHIAAHDALTGLKNRSALMKDLQALFESGRDLHLASLIFVDLDGFKLINDSLGHIAGDELLVEVARRFTNQVDPADTLARLGGDEFAIFFLQRKGSFDALHLAERIVRSLHIPISISGQSVVVSCSVGIAKADVTHRYPNDLLRDADIAMYEAKKLGKNRYAVFDLSMRSAAVRELALQNALRESVEKNAFDIFYQPIYRASNGEVVAIEALLRWNHPVLGSICPDIFIPIAEETGLIFALGEWVMRQACKQFELWRIDGMSNAVMLNVNVSGMELFRDGFLDGLHNILYEANLPPRNLQLEVTESIFLHAPHCADLILDELKQLGVRIALDDFGTGYSSLGYIDRYPIDAIKIDKSFVSRIMIHSRSKAIIQSILWLGTKLGLEITAEGVETPAQYKMLLSMSCPYLQGFFLSPPMTSNDMADALRQA